MCAAATPPAGAGGLFIFGSFRARAVVFLLPFCAGGCSSQTPSELPDVCCCYTPGWRRGVIHIWLFQSPCSSLFTPFLRRGLLITDSFRAARCVLLLHPRLAPGGYSYLALSEPVQ